MGYGHPSIPTFYTFIKATCVNTSLPFTHYIVLHNTYLSKVYHLTFPDVQLISLIRLFLSLIKKPRLTMELLINNLSLKLLMSKSFGIKRSFENYIRKCVVKIGNSRGY